MCLIGVETWEKEEGKVKWEEKKYGKRGVEKVGV